MIQISSRVTASNCTSVNTSNNKLDQIAEVGFVLAAECLEIISLSWKSLLLTKKYYGILFSSGMMNIF